MRFACLMAMIFIFSAIGFLSYSAPDPDLIMYLPMDEGKGDTVKDLSPNGFVGKIVGKDYKWVDGKKGKGLDIVNGTEVQVEDDDRLDKMKALTLELWVYQPEHQATGIVQKGQNWPGMSYLMQPWSDQQIYFGINDTSSRAIAPAGSYSLKKWYHLAGTFDGTTLKVFIDGEEKSSAKSPAKEVPDTATPLQVGNRFTGSIDEFAMYKRALTADEIKRDMAGISLAVESQQKLSIAWGKIKAE
ncbi:TPA: LamG domain-containing protein [Candidatus Poribacteria bacterium]|nr:LamG domain-containing protein [Candidatus Poribacteria bacterium]